MSSLFPSYGLLPVFGPSSYSCLGWENLSSSYWIAPNSISEFEKHCFNPNFDFFHFHHINDDMLGQEKKS